MHISALKESKFLKKEDCGGNGILVTIKGVEHVNIAKEGAPEELKYCLYLEECERPLVLNSTNGQLIAQITGQDDWDHWHGHRIVLYNDPAVSFAGKITGGIRARAPRGQAAKVAPAPKPIAQKPAAAPAEPTPSEDDIPF